MKALIIEAESAATKSFENVTRSLEPGIYLEAPIDSHKPLDQRGLELALFNFANRKYVSIYRKS